MAELSEVEVNQRLLVEVETALEGKTERMLNIKSCVAGQKVKLIECVDRALWDQAQDILNQTHKLSVDAVAADEDVVQAQARVDGLRAAIARAEERARLAAMPPPYVPYAPEPGTAPVVAPDAAPAPIATLAPDVPKAAG